MSLNNIKVGSRLALAFGLLLFIMAAISAPRKPAAPAGELAMAGGGSWETF